MGTGTFLVEIERPERNKGRRSQSMQRVGVQDGLCEACDHPRRPLILEEVRDSPGCVRKLDNWPCHHHFRGRMH